MGDGLGFVPAVFGDDGHAGPAQHIDIVGRVADGHDLVGGYAQEGGDFGQGAGFGGLGAHELEHVGVGAGLGDDLGELAGDAPF